MSRVGPPQLGQKPRPSHENVASRSTAAAAPETGEAAREPPTPQEVPKLVIDERRQTLAVTEPAALHY